MCVRSQTPEVIDPGDKYGMREYVSDTSAMMRGDFLHPEPPSPPPRPPHTPPRPECAYEVFQYGICTGCRGYSCYDCCEYITSYVIRSVHAPPSPPPPSLPPSPPPSPPPPSPPPPSPTPSTPPPSPPPSFHPHRLPGILRSGAHSRLPFIVILSLCCSIL